MKRLSGVVSFVALNIYCYSLSPLIMTVCRITKATANQLAEETHERVGAVIASIVMAIGVIMFYFKGSFNFDTQAKSLKILAKFGYF